MNYANKWDFMKIVQSMKDTGASGQAVSIRNEHQFPAKPIDSIFVGETQSNILILCKLQQTWPQQRAIIQG